MPQKWNYTPKEAIALQKELREQVDLQPHQGSVKLVGGSDLSFNKGSDQAQAGITLLSFPEVERVGHAAVVSTISFPYIPGLLSFREIPPLMDAWQQLEVKPDVVLVDGHGIAHPRRMGIATHFGMVAGVPTIGCAKKILTGRHEPVPDERGAAVPLLDKGEQIGWVLRTREKVKPMFISPGNGLSMQQSLEIARQCMGRYRLPEPTRQAHQLVNQLRKGEIEPGFEQTRPL